MKKNTKPKNPLIVKRVSQSWINSISDKDHSFLHKMSIHSSLMYNFSFYQIRQSFFKSNKSFEENGTFDKILEFKDNYHICKLNENFSILPNACSQQVLQLAHRDFNSFFGLLKKKSKGEYKPDIRIPRYKKKNGETLLSNIIVQGKGVLLDKKKSALYNDVNVYAINASKNFKELYPCEETSHRFEFFVPKDIKKIDEVRIIPTGKSPVKFKLEIVYSVKIDDKKECNNSFLSIDPGLNNLAACFNSNNGNSFIIDGKYIKSINNFYNKKSSKLQSKIDKSKNDKLDFNSLIKKKNKLTHKRNNHINDYFHRSSKYIVQYCLTNNINTIIIGENKEQKQNINIGKVNNQNFVYIPHARFKDILEYKAEAKGIEVKRIEESYTSKTSFIDLEPMKHQEKYLGRRTKRGIFKTKDGILINSDVNGAANILRKYLKSNGKFKEWKDSFFEEASKGIVNYPKKLNLDSLLSEFGFKKLNAR